jgi:hypothetical protein
LTRFSIIFGLSLGRFFREDRNNLTEIDWTIGLDKLRRGNRGIPQNQIFVQVVPLAFTKIHAFREGEKNFRPQKLIGFFYDRMGNTALF